MMRKPSETIQLLQEFSVPLIAGVVVALLVANFWGPQYEAIVHTPVTALFGEHAEADGQEAHHDEVHHDEAHHDEAHHDEAHHNEVANSGAHEKQGEKAKAGDPGSTHGHGGHHGPHWLTLHFWVNDLFMVLFFGIAAKEITEACLPGGALNPPSKAINPLLATIGGVLGPVGVFFGLNAAFGSPDWAKGWGIPTATDIALAWLVARMVFGKGHPAVSFLLLLAVADDAIGLGIIALAYPDPNNPTVWTNALWIVPAMAGAYGLRRMKVMSWLPYVAIGGLAWWGLYSAHLHPALALVFIVPFMPGPGHDLGLYVESEKHAEHIHQHSPLENFEHQLKPVVDFGLFFFAFANAGVPMSGVSALTWIILGSLLLGKTLGITAFSVIGDKLGFPMPRGMQTKHVVVTAVIAGLGLTVALFVSGQAFTNPEFQGAAKMGALLSGGIALIAIALGKLWNVKDGCDVSAAQAPHHDLPESHATSPALPAEVAAAEEQPVA